ncbi:MAG: penicillin-binding transpeptidase domain-containing protein [Bacteroidota bacterium]
MSGSQRIIIQGFILLVSIIFVTKLFSIQVKNVDYKQAAANNIIQKVIEYPYRGLIKDRNGELLVYNSPIYDLMVVPREVSVRDTSKFCALFDLTIEEFNEKIQEAKEYSYVKPSVFIKQIPNEEFAKIQDLLVDYRGFNVVPRIKRAYEHPILANAFGYIGEINKSRLERDTSEYYLQGDYVGISGLEASYEKHLRGKRGEKLKMVNVRGIEKGSFQDGIFDTDAIAGEDLVSTIDTELQIYAEKLMEGKVGSVIALEPATGEILSIASAPTYDPELMTGRMFGENFTKLQQDSLVPLFNRPIMADVYPPGSIFKLFQTLVALQEGVVSLNTYYSCNQNLIGCHGHGPGETLIGAIKNSCNPYFYNVFRSIINQNDDPNTYIDARIGLERWREYLLDFGMGRRLGIDIPNEKRGVIPSLSLYDNIYGENRWKFSNVYSLSIGQGELGVSPLQMANLVSILANRGYYYPPHIIKSIGENGQPLPKYQQKIETGVDAPHFDVVIEAMAKVIESGTGQYRAKLKGIEVCGKTGTVENPHGEDHSVFIAFAPRDKPKIAVSVYVENAGQGARAAAAISGLMIEKYIKRDSAELRMEDYVLAGEFIY